jgi:hypothetical protein
MEKIPNDGFALDGESHNPYPTILYKQHILSPKKEGVWHTSMFF